MFIGRHYHQIENKGRVAIPSPFRPQLQSGGVITWGLDGCLFLFPDSYWQKLSKKLASLSLTNPNARHFTQLLVQSAVNLALDKQGRTLLPQHLRDQANLKKQVVIAGALTRIEIWDKSLYHQHIDKVTRQMDKIDDQLIELEI